MAKKDSSFKTMTTVDGITFHLYEDEKGIIKPHSMIGPAIIYPKSILKPDEYYIYGVKHDFDKWLELSRSLRKTLSKEDFVD